MNLYLVEKYTALLSNSLSKFKRVDRYNWNFRCPVCGDSKTNPNKARGYLLASTNKVKYYCHNCHITLSFDKLLAFIDPALHKQYRIELFKSGDESIKRSPAGILADKMKAKPYKSTTAFKHLKSISQLSSNHPAKQYVVQRKIPSKFHHKLYYTSGYYALVNKFIANKYKYLDDDHPRLVIPLLTTNHQLIGFQGRALGDQQPKYISTIINKDYPTVYGWDTVDFNYKYFCVEGPIDSMYLSNAIALCGSNIVSQLNQLKSNINNAIICYDNQPRNNDIARAVAGAIDRNYNVFIWPPTIAEKDVGQMIENGYSSQAVEQMILSNTYRGLKAKLAFSKWRI